LSPFTTNNRPIEGELNWMSRTQRSLKVIGSPFGDFSHINN